MSDAWRSSADQLHSIEAEQPTTLDLSLNTCLFAMVRFLIEQDRVKRPEKPLSEATDSQSSTWTRAAAV